MYTKPLYTKTFPTDGKFTKGCASLLLTAVLSACNGGSGEDEIIPTNREALVKNQAEADKEKAIPNLDEITRETMPPTDFSLINPQPGDITDLILVTGQSNVRGSNTGYDSVLDTPNKQAFAFNYDDQWRVGDLHNAWDGAWAPGSGSLQDSTRQPHNSFVFHFGKVVSERDSSRVIGYVVASAPGMGISHWDRNREFFYEVRDLAIKALNAQGVKSTFDAILWHQGETDWQINGTSDTEISDEQRYDPNYYSNKLYSLIADLRGQPWMDNNAYFICGETAMAPVNEILMRLNSDDDPRTGCVSSEGLSTLDIDPTPIHFDAVSLRELGKRYAELYLSMTQ